MQKNVKNVLTKACVTTLALAMVAPMVNASSASAASKPKFAKKSVSVTVGKTTKLSVKGKKIKKTTWSVKSKKIAKITKKSKSGATVKGVKTGTTKVTAKVKAGKKTYKITATVKVKKKTVPPTSAPTATTTTSVVNPTTAPSKAPANPTSTPDTSVGISLDKTELTVDYMKTATLTATKKNTNDAVTWTSSDEKVASVKDGVVTANGDDKATATITATVSGVSATCKVTVNKCAIGTVIASDNYNDGNANYTSARSTSKDPVVAVVDGDHDGKCYQVTGRAGTAQGALFDMTNICEPGSTYTFKAYFKVGDTAPEDESAILSSEIQAVETGSESYDNLAVITAKQGNFQGAADESYADPKKWQLMEFTFTAPDDMYHFGLYFETKKSDSCDLYVDDLSITLMDRNVPDYSIKNLKDVFVTENKLFSYLGVGAGYDQIMGENAGNFINSQFNSYTPGNCYKPDAILGSTINKLPVDKAKEQGYYIPDGYADCSDNKSSIEDAESEYVGYSGVVVPALDYTRVDQVLERAHKLGIKMRAHTLVWHQQTPVYFFKQKYKAATTATNTDAATMDLRLDYFITNEMNHILEKDLELAGGDKSKCVLYAWDVANEYLHSHNANNANTNTNGLTFYEDIYGKNEDGTYIYETNGNKMSTTPSYVKKAFKLAYDNLVAHDRTDISLIYNDFNTYDVTSDMIDLVNFINEKDDINTDGAKLCDGVGMQAHLKVNSPTAERFANTVKAFKDAGFEIQVTELDATTVNKLSDMDSDALAAAYEDQAVYYKAIMKSLIENRAGDDKVGVTSVILWSLYDATSWRAEYAPNVFKGLYNIKPAFDAIIAAAEEAK